MAPTIERHIPVFPDHEHLWRRKSKGVDLMLEDAASQASVLHGAFERAWTQLCAAAGVDRPHADWQAPLETVRPGGSVRCTRTGQTLDTRGNARVSPARGPVCTDGAPIVPPEHSTGGLNRPRRLLARPRDASVRSPPSTSSATPPEGGLDQTGGSRSPRLSLRRGRPRRRSRSVTMRAADDRLVGRASKRCRT